MNSAQMHCSLEKVNICGYCSCNSAWTVTAFLQKRVKKKKKKKTQNADGETQTCYPNYPLHNLYEQNLSTVPYVWFLRFLKYERKREREREREREEEEEEEED